MLISEALGQTGPTDESSGGAGSPLRPRGAPPADQEGRRVGWFCGRLRFIGLIYASKLLSSPRAHKAVLPRAARGPACSLGRGRKGAATRLPPSVTGSNHRTPGRRRHAPAGAGPHPTGPSRARGAPVAGRESSPPLPAVHLSPTPRGGGGGGARRRATAARPTATPCRRPRGHPTRPAGRGRPRPSPRWCGRLPTVVRRTPRLWLDGSGRRRAGGRAGDGGGAGWRCERGGHTLVQRSAPWRGRRARRRCGHAPPQGALGDRASTAAVARHPISGTGWGAGGSDVDESPTGFGAAVPLSGAPAAASSARGFSPQVGKTRHWQRPPRCAGGSTTARHWVGATGDSGGPPSSALVLLLVWPRSLLFFVHVTPRCRPARRVTRCAPRALCGPARGAANRAHSQPRLFSRPTPMGIPWGGARPRGAAASAATTWTTRAPAVAPPTGRRGAS